MRYIWHHIQTILDNYSGGIPLSHFLKNYFRLHPKLGSRDRKIISEMAYSWYRCSRLLDDTMPLEQKIAGSLFLAETTNTHSLNFVPPDWRDKAHLPTSERIAFMNSQGVGIDILSLAPFTTNLSGGIEPEEWLTSMLTQPQLFIRIRKRGNEIKAILKDNGIEAEEVRPNTLALPNGSAIDKLLPQDSYVVQDLSSQQTGNYFYPKPGEDWWDCCSGAGGKSLLLMDMQPGVQLTVSDKRQTILRNLVDRFSLYKHQQPAKYMLDAADEHELQSKLGDRQFDNIICDAPCSGSGTWARTPEQLFFFKEEYISDFASLQQTIAGNTVRFLKSGGRLIYITCSVFRKENEAVVDAVIEQHKLTIEHQELINGTERKADSMYIAVLRK